MEHKEDMISCFFINWNHDYMLHYRWKGMSSAQTHARTCHPCVSLCHIYAYEWARTALLSLSFGSIELTEWIISFDFYSRLPNTTNKPCYAINKHEYETLWVRKRLNLNMCYTTQFIFMVMSSYNAIFISLSSHLAQHTDWIINFHQLYSNFCRLRLRLWYCYTISYQICMFSIDVECWSGKHWGVSKRPNKSLIKTLRTESFSAERRTMVNLLTESKRYFSKYALFVATDGRFVILFIEKKKGKSINLIQFICLQRQRVNEYHMTRHCKHMMNRHVPCRYWFFV